MNNVGTRRTAGKKTVNKSDFTRNLQGRLSKSVGVEVSLDTTQAIFEQVLDEIRAQVKRGNRVNINDFGMFYAKRMKSRKVVGGLFEESYDKPFRVPAKTKIGFSSSPTGDRTVSRRPSDQARLR